MVTPKWEQNTLLQALLACPRVTKSLQVVEKEVTIIDHKINDKHFWTIAMIAKKKSFIQIFDTLSL